MKSAKSYIGIALIALLAQGCVTWQLAKPTPFVNSSAKYSIQLPAQWKHISTPQALVVSLYGPQLHSIRIEHKKHKQAFRSQKKDSNPDMAPQELADAVIAELKAQPGADAYEVLKIEPALLGGVPGFRAELASKRTFQGDAIRFQHVVYGAVNAEGLYVIYYEGPVIHYFAKFLPDFERAAKSFAFTAQQPRKA